MVSHDVDGWFEPMELFGSIGFLWGLVRINNAFDTVKEIGCKFQYLTETFSIPQ